MERSEPTLIPEWLRSAGSLNGGGSISHSDEQTATKLVRNKSFVNSNGHDSGRSFSSDRTTSSYFRRSSSSNGSGHLKSHSSFGRNHHDRDWEKDGYDSRDKDKSVLGDRWHRDFSDAMGNTLLSQYERDGLRRSQSMISGKRGDTWHKKVGTDLNIASGNNTNGLPSKGSPIGGVNKTTFERDFPSLGAEERAVIPEVGRVPSPGVSSALQSLPIGTPTIIRGEKWRSALAEVPVLIGNNVTGIASVQQAAPSSSTSVALGSTTSLNMAEAVAQGPTRAQTTPQLSIGTQRLEELAIKQSRQLIPVTPSMPKPLDQLVYLVSLYAMCFIEEGQAASSVDKQKTKVGQQQNVITSSLAANQSPRGGPVKSDVSKTSNVGKLHVLKPVREKNGITPVVKENLSPTSGSKPVSSPLAAPSLSGSAATRGPPNNPVADRKPVLTVLEKRPTSQAQSRNDFFNSVRKKSLANSASVADAAIANSSPVDNGPAVLPSFSDKLAETELVVAPNTSRDLDASSGVSLSGDNLSETRSDTACNGDVCDAQNYVRNGKKNNLSDPIFSEEEEAAFLRSLGWRRMLMRVVLLMKKSVLSSGMLLSISIFLSYYHNSHGDLYLSRDCILPMGMKSSPFLLYGNILIYFAFSLNMIVSCVAQYVDSKPSLKILQAVQPKILLPFDSHIGGISSGLNSPDAKLES
ncbi:UNVERIFIED_CONTAM: hypothetical protein Sangu_1055100 [Sesamum angustifolium]|uniref:Uncharacterized protein n=1 Tax=Sesamum angustifolium TaxID=2727405 RepID=A0AAW2NYC8_9LAMI